MIAWNPAALDLFRRHCENRRDALLAAGADPSIQNSKGFTADANQMADGRAWLPEDVRALIRQHRLAQVAQASRPQDSDLASPEEALARRSRGRFM